MQPTNPYLWPSYCNGATAREILRSSPKAWNQIKIATNANVTVLWDPLLLSSSDFPMNIPRPNSRAAFWLVAKNAENLLVNQIPLWAIGAQDISYLSCQVLLGFRTAPRDIRHFLKLCCDFQYLNAFFALFRAQRTWWDVGEDNRQCFTTSRHWEHPEEAPPNPLQYGSQGNFFPHSHIVRSHFKSVSIRQLQNILCKMKA